ncbi:MAG: helix-turn-helix domain-containing protein [Bacteroidia bacterium]|jgi:transcriptional regulator with XRE-family HTH domain|nr:helix-turn-helix domain-containing protein [Bacteroidia bacterium]MBP7436232.1 helix-turn-helix domain-containing protein [Bacteroidia bacterium]MBP7728335.1 helix-turn-helix domain-containing protein [Bacteroidia bacterium]MBP7772907.1 helix-turn-helix domain-containing protein [Bacteroidia bacterium]HPD53824.1 helix-turn-helix domain-containing protein [Bacteroidia bacterium]
MYFNTNIKILRQRKNRTQDIVANELGVTRSTLNSYENGSIKNPTLDMLIGFSKYFKLSIDTLVKVDLSKLSDFQLSELEKGNDVYVSGSRLRVLATTVDSQNRENIEVVPIRAKAGYQSGYADPEFIKKLPTFQLPILLNDRKYRMFQLSGDSMLPIPDKAWVIGEYVENWFDIKDGQGYIVLTQDDGIVFKIAYNQLKKKKNLLLKSLNPNYPPFEVPANQIREVWRFCNYLSSELPETELRKDDLREKFDRLEQEIQAMRTALE